jgi:hypothetical protein
VFGTDKFLQSRAKEGRKEGSEEGRKKEGMKEGRWKEYMLMPFDG